MIQVGAILAFTLVATVFCLALKKFKRQLVAFSAFQLGLVMLDLSLGLEFLAILQSLLGLSIFLMFYIFGFLFGNFGASAEKSEESGGTKKNALPILAALSLTGMLAFAFTYIVDPTGSQAIQPIRIGEIQKVWMRESGPALWILFMAPALLIVGIGILGRGEWKRFEGDDAA